MGRQNGRVSPAFRSNRGGPDSADRRGPTGHPRAAVCGRNRPGAFETQDGSHGHPAFRQLGAASRHAQPAGMAEPRRPGPVAGMGRPSRTSRECTSGGYGPRVLVVWPAGMVAIQGVAGRSAVRLVFASSPWCARGLAEPFKSLRARVTHFAGGRLLRSGGIGRYLMPFRTASLRRPLRWSGGM